MHKLLIWLFFHVLLRSGDLNKLQFHTAQLYKPYVIHHKCVAMSHPDPYMSLMKSFQQQQVQCHLIHHSSDMKSLVNTITTNPSSQWSHIMVVSRDLLAWFWAKVSALFSRCSLSDGHILHVDAHQLLSTEREFAQTSSSFDSFKKQNICTYEFERIGLTIVLNKSIPVHILFLLSIIKDSCYHKWQ